MKAGREVRRIKSLEFLSNIINLLTIRYLLNDSFFLLAQIKCDEEILIVNEYLHIFIRESSAFALEFTEI